MRDYLDAAQLYVALSTLSALPCPAYPPNQPYAAAPPDQPYPPNVNPARNSFSAETTVSGMLWPPSNGNHVTSSPAALARAWNRSIVANGSTPSLRPWAMKTGIVRRLPERSVADPPRRHLDAARIGRGEIGESLARPGCALRCRAATRPSPPTRPTSPSPLPAPALRPARPALAKSCRSSSQSRAG